MFNVICKKKICKKTKPEPLKTPDFLEIFSLHLGNPFLIINYHDICLFFQKYGFWGGEDQFLRNFSTQV